jgi:NAD(P)-dependent dehydrogenase (short-subunit alcohol dehydrogenase family)
LITGSGSGIGEAMAYRFAEAGANLDLVDIDETSILKVKQELSHLNRVIDIHRIDLSEKTEIDFLWRELEGKEPDILVNNAGIYPSKPFTEVDEDFLAKVMDVNLNSVFWMCQQMVKRRLNRGGVIINIGSIEAVMPLKEELSHYGISKGGVMILSRALASEYGKHGFRINALVPGGTWTKGTRNVARDLRKMKLGLVKAGVEYGIRTPLGRLADPDEIARMALVLATDLSTYVNGALITVDGGFLSA